MRFVLPLLCFALLTACGQTVRGDPGGVPVDVVVVLDREWVAAMSEDVMLVGAGPGAEDGQEAHFGFGHGVWSGSTKVTLVASARSDGTRTTVFRQALSWGANRFTLPLRPGRELELDVAVTGERRGVRGLGVWQVPAGDDSPVLRLDLTRRSLDDALPAAGDD